MAGNSVTIDVKARVTGYEESLAKMQKDVEKLDIGKEFGKSMSKAFTSVQSQVKDLSKNMFPKASSDTQINSIIDRANQAGDAIYRMTTAMQNVTATDLDFSKAGGELAAFSAQAAQLQNELSTKLTQGMRDAVTSSTELSQVFSNLGIDASKASIDEMFSAIKQGARSAEKDVASAGRELARLQEEREIKQSSLDRKMAGPLGTVESRDSYLSQLEMAQKNYDAKMAEMRDKIGQNLQSLISGSGKDLNADTLLNNFFQGLTPENVQDRITSLFSTLNTAGLVDNLRGDFYTKVFGAGPNDNINSVLNALNIQGIVGAVREAINHVFSETNLGGEGGIQRLLNDGDIDTAAERTSEKVRDGYNKVQQEIKKGQEDVNKATERESNAQGRFDAAQNRQNQYSQIEQELRNELTSLKTANENLEVRLKQAEDKVAQLSGEEVNKMRGNARAAGENALGSKFPTDAAKEYRNQLQQVTSAEQAIGKMQGITQRWFSVYAVVRGVTKAIKTVISDTKEFDKTITDIAIVTNKSQDDLWGQMDQYTEMARKYGASIAGVYKVSQLYYQQGLQEADVMALSAETLKMARISGLDYAQSTDYMTNAIRSFKMEMTDAGTVVDTYSAIAAKSATSVSELATAMSKTASSAQSVGADIQSTTAMMAVMIEATRESPENIGSAMKSIISRYGELKENKTGIDAEGEEYSLNKVDKALQTVGISIHDANGEFRDFDDVIFELADHWDQIDKNTQRYIATVMAGNRQQSRFLALVSSGERLKELANEAYNSEDASQGQFLKTMDSIEYKSQQLQTSLQSLYTDSGVQNLFKGILDTGNNIIQTFTNMPKMFELPIPAIAKFAMQFASIANIVTTTFGLIKSGLQSQISAIRNKGLAEAQNTANQEVAIEQTKNEQILTSRLNLARETSYNNLISAGKSPEEAALLLQQMGLGPTNTGGANGPATVAKPGIFQKGGLFGKGSRGIALAGLGLNLAGTFLTGKAMAMGEETQQERNQKALLNGLGMTAQGAGMGAMFGPVGALIGGIGGAIVGAIEGISIRDESAEERRKRLNTNLENAQNENIQKKQEFKSLKTEIDDFKRLRDLHLESTEAADDYIAKCNEIAEAHPDLVQGYDAEGNAIINLSEAYKKLKKAKEDVSDSEKKEADAQIDAAANAVKDAEAAHAAALTDEAIFKSGEGEDVAERKAELQGIANTILTAGDMSLQYSTGIRETLSAFMTGNFDKAKELIKTNVEDFKLEQKLNGEDSPLSSFFSLVDTVSTQVEDIESNLTSSDDQVKKAAGEQKKAEATQRAKYKIGAKSVVDSEIQELLLEDEINNTSASSYLSQFKNASTLMTRSIVKKAEEFKNENPEGKYFEDGEFDKDFDKVNKELADLSNTLGPKALSRLDEYIANQGNYTKEQTERQLDNLFDGVEAPELQAALMSYYDDALITPKDVTGAIAKIYLSGRDNHFIGRFIASRQDTLEQLGSNELQSVMSFYNNIVDAVESKSITTETADQITSTYMDLWNAATTKLFGTKSDEVQKLLTESNFTSNEGIEKFLSNLSNLGVTLDQLGMDENTFKNIQFPENFSGRVQAFANQTIDSMTNFDKDLGNATKGMDFGEASKLASKLGMDLTQFRREGTKFFLDDYNAIKDYYFKDYNKDLADLQTSQEKELSQLSEYKDTEKGNDLNNIADGFKKYKDNELELNKNLDAMFDTSDKGNEAFINSLTRAHITPERLKNQIADYIKNGKEGETFLKYMKDHFQQEYDAYAGAANDALLHSINESYLQNGQLDEFVNSITSDTSYNEQARQNLRQQAIDRIRKRREEEFKQGKLTSPLFAKEGGTKGYTEEEVNAELDSMSDEVKQEEDRLKENEKAQLREAIKSGDITKLTGKLKEYSKVILDTYKNVNSSVTNGLLDAMDGGAQQIALDANNRDIIGDLISKHPGWFKLPEGETIDTANYVEILTSALEQDEKGFTDFVNAQSLTRKERAEYMKKWHDIKYPDPSDIASKMITSASRLDYNAVEDLYAVLGQSQESKEAFAERIGLDLDDYGATFKDYNKYISTLNEQIEKTKDETVKRQLKAELASAQRLASTQKQIDTHKAVEDLLKDTDSISEESRKALESAIGVDEAKKYFLDNKDGTHKLNVRELRQDIESGYLDIIDSEKDALLESFASLGDEAISAVDSITAMITSGTKKQSDMQKIVNEFQGKYTQAQLFKYDELIDAYTFDPSYLQEYQAIQAQKYADAMDVSYDQAIQEVSKQTQKTMASQIDIKGFLDAEAKGQDSQAYKKLNTSLQNYFKLLSPDAIAEDYIKFMSLDDLNAIQIGGRSLLPKSGYQDANFVQKQRDYLLERYQQGKKDFTIDYNKFADNMINNVAKGGMTAVNIMKLWADLSGKELTSSDIESAYRAQVSQIENSFEQLITGPGGIVTGTAKTILETLQSQGKASITALDANNAVVNSITDIAAAYQEYYNLLAKSGEATLESLNNAKAKVLETKGGRDKEQKAIDALGDAAGMTYSTFGQLLTDMGIELTDDLMQSLTDTGIIESLGGAKMRIKDFATFARAMKWDFDSEEYTSAFSSFNDGLIEQNKKVKESVNNEIQNLKDAKPGDWLNLTQFEKTFKKYSKDSKSYLKQTQEVFDSKRMAVDQAQEFAKNNKLFNDLQNSLISFGAYLDDGILKLSENANLLGVAETLKNAAIESGSEMSAELADMVQTIVTSYTDTITKGIEGGMTNAEREDLIQKASTLGIDLKPENFQQMAEGFQLSSQAAMDLYAAMGKTDAFQKNKIYKVLSKQLKATNKNYETTTSMLARMKELSESIDELDKKKNANNEKYLDQLKNELSLMKEMYANSLSHEDQTWQFMSTDVIPDSIKNAMNYSQNWGQAMEQLGQWSMTGKTDLNQFASLLKHVTELSDFAGQSLSFMGQQIGGENGLQFDDFLNRMMKAAEYNAKSGQWELNNKKLASEFGFNMNLGSKGISQEVKDQAAALAEYNQKEVEGFAKFGQGLSAIKKQFQDYSHEADGFGHAFEDFLDANGNFQYDRFKKQMESNEKSRKAFNEFTKNVEIDGQSYEAAMSSAGKTIEKGSKQYKAIQGIIAMAMSETWDTESSYNAVAEQLQASGFEGQIKLNDVTFEAQAGRTLYKSNKDQQWTGPNGEKFDTPTQAWDSYNQQDIQNLQTQLNQYQQKASKDGKYDIQLDGQTYKLSTKGGKIIDEKGKEYSSVSEWQKSLYQDYVREMNTVNISKDINNRRKTKQKINQPLSYEAWQLRAQQKSGANGAATFSRKLTSAAQEAMQAAGLATPEAVKQAWDSMYAQYGEDAVYEWEAKFKMKPKLAQDGKTMTDDIAKEYSDAINFDNISASVSEGISKAFTGDETAGGIRQAISGAIQDGITGGEDGKIPVDIVAEANVDDAQSKINAIKRDGNVIVPVVESGVAAVKAAINSITGKTVTINVVSNGTTGITKPGVTTAPAGPNISVPKAKGTIGLAHAKSTLMGELGPEMVVSNGRYFVVGQNGPEFVDLADDAIVFNHLQTKSLFEKGMSHSRGHAVTNEQVAVAYAHGNVHGGPAHAVEGRTDITNWTSMWQGPGWVDAVNGVMNSVKGTGQAVEEALDAFIKKLDEWYNQLQEIAKIEEKITYQETLRSKIDSDLTKNGSAYYKSWAQSMLDLNDSIEENQALYLQQEDYLSKRISTLNSENSPWSKLYTLDSEGQVKYKDGMKEVFGEKFGATDANKPNYTPQEQYNWLISQGFGEFLKYDSNGKEIEFTDKEGKENQAAYKTAVESFWKTMEDELTEVQDLKDSIDEHQKAVLEAQQKQNELLQEMRDNQMELENKVLDAIVESREREIDEMEKTKDVYSEYSDKLVNGLTDALNKEREMYQMQDDQAETDKMRRRLAILQSSGGSASEIIDLQEQIRQRDRDMYFEEQEKQINAIKEASDLEIERMDEQISLEKEVLEYQKTYGLLWEQVYDVMAKSPLEIADYIKNNTQEFWGASPVKSAEDLDDVLYSAQKWQNYRDGILGDSGDSISNQVKIIADSVLTNDGKKEWENFVAALNQTYGKDFTNDTELLNAYLAKYKETSDPNQAAAAAKAILEARGTKTAAQEAAEAAAAQEAANAGGSVSFSGGKNGETYGYTFVDANGQVQNKTGYRTADEAAKAAEEAAKKSAGDVINQGYGTLADYDYQQGNAAYNKALTSTTNSISVDTSKKSKDYAKALETAKNTNNAGTYYNNLYTKKSKAIGNAFAKGTLLGELGPEAWIANGKFHIAGQYGAEMVNLPNDAIVFNHQQTARLLRTGKAGRGNAINGEDAALGNKERNSYINTFWDQVARNRASMESINYPSYATSSSLEHISNELQNNNANEAITIEHAEVNMNVEQLANDYDAKRAGEQALQEMLRIARKGSATTLRR